MIGRFEEQERLASESEDEEDYGSDLDGIADAYDSEEDSSFEEDEDDYPIRAGM
jgi:hypothetical protein